MVCRFGNQCRRAVCLFAHPTVAAPAPAAAMTTTTTAALTTMGGGGNRGAAAQQQQVAVEERERTVLVPQTRVVREQRRPGVVASFLIDASGSMAGARMAAACDGLRAALGAALRDSDLLALATFADARIVHQKLVRRRDADLDALVERVKANVGGRTRLLDSLAEQVAELQRVTRGHGHRRQMRALVALTDGGDNMSTRSVRELAALLGKPGIADFHFVLVGVGLDSRTKATLADELCAPQHATFIDVADADAASIRRAFGSVARTIERRVTELVACIERTTTASTTTTTMVAGTLATAAPQRQQRRVLGR